MSGPDSTRTDVTGTLRLCRGIATQIYRLGATAQALRLGASVELLVAFVMMLSLTGVTIPDSLTSIGDSAFASCGSLASVTIGNSPTRIAENAFRDCTSLTAVYFQGNAPTWDCNAFAWEFDATAYYLPGTTGWDTFICLPTALWFLPNPLILSSPSFGVGANGFGFIISWATNTSVVVEACTDLANPIWLPASRNTLTDGWSYFSDPQWRNYARRFYRVRSP